MDIQISEGLFLVTFERNWVLGVLRMDAAYSREVQGLIIVPIRPQEGRFPAIQFVACSFEPFLLGTRPRECHHRIQREKLCLKMMLNPPGVESKVISKDCNAVFWDCRPELVALSPEIEHSGFCILMSAVFCAALGDQM